MKHAIWIVALMACCFCLAMAVAQRQQDASAAAPPNQSPAAKSTASPSQNLGELKFQQNCSRCHNAPQELSPRITGSVVLHMRVRASLSQADAKAILQYLAP